MCKEVCVRTNIVIDDEIMRQAQQLAGTKTKRETVDLALRTLVAKHRRLKILGLPGKVEWTGDMSDWRAARRH
jgi:Arc/MetJ family transcription regulator